MTLLSILLTATVSIAILVTNSHTGIIYAQNIPKEKEDVFKVIVTLFGVEAENGDIVTFVTIDNMSKIKAFDAAMYSSLTIDRESEAKTNNSADGLRGGSNHVGRGIVELFYAFPNTTSIKSGDEFRACSMVLKDLKMICKTGENTPAQNVKDVQMYLDNVKPLRWKTYEEEENRK